MSADFDSDDQSFDATRFAALFAFADPGPSEPVSLRAIAALSIDARAREERAERRASIIYWDDTGERMMYDRGGALATGDEMEEKPPTG